jgi:hypothetical protein
MLEKEGEEKEEGKEEKTPNTADQNLSYCSEYY